MNWNSDDVNDIEERRFVNFLKSEYRFPCFYCALAFAVLVLGIGILAILFWLFR